MPEAKDNYTTKPNSKLSTGFKTAGYKQSLAESNSVILQNASKPRPRGGFCDRFYLL